MLLQEYCKIEARKQDRDRKAEDLQKLIKTIENQNNVRKILKPNKKTPATNQRKRNAVPVRPTRVDPNVMLKLRIKGSLYMGKCCNKSTLVLTLFS